jgi:hypothetical protein
MIASPPSQLLAAFRIDGPVQQATAGIPKPGFLLERTDVFAQSDRAAWDDASLAPFRALPPIARIANRLRPLHPREQLIHGDLTTNVLFHPTLLPGIIDLSPYWRPPLFATAVVAVDALIWERADWPVLCVIDQQQDSVQYLLRAAVFRLVMDHLCNPRRPAPPSWWPTATRVVACLCAWRRDPQPHQPRRPLHHHKHDITRAWPVDRGVGKPIRTLMRLSVVQTLSVPGTPIIS